MALAPVQLDDLSWREMVESVRRRIPGASDGAWTHHAAVDPGVTLLELFAWLIEQRIFWIDQVPADLTRALFALLGERTEGPKPAATVLACDVPTGAAFSDLPAGLEFTFSSVDAERVFTTRTGAVLAPVARFGVHTADGDRTADLRARKPIPMMRNDGAAGECTVVFWMTHAGPVPSAQEKVAVLIDVDTFGRIEPEWSPASVADVDAPAALAWSYSTGPGAWRDFDSPAVEDGTGGLRRSGVVRFPLAADWAPMGPAVGGQSPFALRVRTRNATFTVPPLLRGLSANAVIADHWKIVTAPAADLADHARHWLRLPDQELHLPADEPPAIPSTVELMLRERDGQQQWVPAADFSSSDRTSRVFVVDRERGTLRFGDGVNGRIPIPHDADAPEIAVTYRAGAGVGGNLAPRKRWFASHAGATIEAQNPVAAVGGAEAETLEEATARIAGGLKRQQRAITAADHEELAKTTPGVAVARALAVVGLHPLFPCDKTPGAVTVFVVAFAPRPDSFGWTWPDPTLVAAPAIDPGALAGVQARLEGARLVASQVFARPVQYRPVSLRVDVSASPADADAIKARLGAALSRYLDPLAGGESGTGLPFGEPVRPSALLRVAQDTLLGEGVVEQVSVGLDDQPPAENCRDLAIGPYQLAYLRALSVFYRAQASAGGLP